MKMWKTKRQVSHIFTAPWKTLASFPQLPQGLSRAFLLFSSRKNKGKSLHGEYPIKGWHGVNLCRCSRLN
jgi:hypothetical protein